MGDITKAKNIRGAHTVILQLNRDEISALFQKTKASECSCVTLWSKQNNQIITFEKLMYDFGGPGKVFQLDEKSMEGYLERLEQDSKNFVFSRGAGGLRQISSKVNKISETQLIKNCYKKVA